jgi:hypothetical protein
MNQPQRIFIQVMRSHQITKEPLEGGKFTAHGALFPVFCQSGQIRPYDMNVDLAYIRPPVSVQTELPRYQEAAKLDEVAQIIPQRVRRQVALIAQMIGVLLNEPFHSCVLSILHRITRT